MSGAQSTLIAVGALTLLSAWVLYVLRPWQHPQHVARYHPDPLEVAAVTETVPDWPDWVDRTVPYAEVEGSPPWDLEVTHDVYEDPLSGRAGGENGSGPRWLERWLPAPEAGAEGVPLPSVQGMAPNQSSWLDLEEEATARAGHGELVFGDSLGWQSGGCLDEATLREGLARVNAIPVASRIIDVLRELETPRGEDGLTDPPGEPAGAGDEAEGPHLAAPLAPVPCPECGEEPCWLVQLFGEESQ